MWQPHIRWKKITRLSAERGKADRSGNVERIIKLLKNAHVKEECDMVSLETDVKLNMTVCMEHTSLPSQSDGHHEGCFPSKMFPQGILDRLKGHFIRAWKTSSRFQGGTSTLDSSFRWRRPFIQRDMERWVLTKYPSINGCFVWTIWLMHPFL